MSMSNFLRRNFTSFASSAAIAAMLGIVGLSGCAPTEPTEPAIPPTSEDILTEEPTTPDTGNSQENEDSESDLESLYDYQDLSYAYFGLGLNLLKNIDTQDGNLLVSPVSLSRPLSALALGADGETKQQIEDVLGFTDGLPTEDIKSVANTWKDMDSFKVGDSIWINQTFSPKEDFIAESKADFNLEVYKEPFNQATTDEINGWVAQHTNNMIPSILSSPLQADNPMVLVNACAFDGTWDEPYEEHQVEQKDFTNADGSKSIVDMMGTLEEDCYFENDFCTGFMKEYDSDGIGFVGILPDEDVSLSEMLEKFDGTSLSKFMVNFLYTDVISGLPKFDGEYTLPLNEILKKLGMTDAFEAAKANFSGISDDDLWVSDVLQKTFVEVDEEGTKAAAATAVEMAESTAMSEPEPSKIKEVILDRPFLYIIYDRTNNIPLFMGTMSTFE